VLLRLRLPAGRKGKNLPVGVSFGEKEPQEEIKSLSGTAPLPLRGERPRGGGELFAVIGLGVGPAFGSKIIEEGKEIAKRINDQKG